MKATFYVLITILVISCGSDQKLNTSFKNDDLIALVNSKTEVGDLSANEYDSEWIPVQSRKEMLTSFFGKIKDREYEVFNFFPGEMSPINDEELSYFFHHVDTELVENDLGDYVPIMVEETFDPSGMRKRGTSCFNPLWCLGICCFFGEFGSLCYFSFFVANLEGCFCVEI